MNCMKCGTEITSGVFCADCLTDMERYPVKPNIKVQLPVRRATPPAKKKARQKYVKPEDQISHLKRVRNWLVVLLITALLAFAASSIICLQLLEERDEGFGIGQNYGTSETSQTTESFT